jgi:polar amino acid transport system substrate-binding protein
MVAAPGEPVHGSDLLGEGEPDTQVTRELAPLGRLRAAINLGNPVLAQRQSTTGELTGVSVDLAHKLGSRLRVPVELIAFDAAGKVFAALETDAWDVAFLAIDPVRAAGIAFTPPYVVIEGTYLVRATSPLQSVGDFERPGLRIAVGRGAAYDLFLTRALKAAELVRADTSAGAVELFLESGLDAAAGVRQQLAACARARGGLRVIEGDFMAIHQAMGTPRGREAGLKYLIAFIERMKREGFVAAALARSGQDATVAPPAA